MVAIVVLRLAFELWWVDRIHEHLWTQIGVSLLYMAGVLFLFLAAADIPHARLDIVGFAVLVMCLGFYAVSSMTVFALHYTSDALLFVHQSSNLLLQGLNPYQHDLVGGYEAFQVPYYVATPTTSGGIVTDLNYPALSFLVYTPFVALGLNDLRPVSAAFLLATVGLLFMATPRHLRLLLLSGLFLSSFFLSFALSGFDIIYVFLLLVAVVSWKHNTILGMVAFGLSAAVKQTVWFIAPFLLVRLWREAPGDSKSEKLWHVAKASSFGFAAFLLPNAWFVVWDPMAWLHGVLTPLGGSGDTLVPLSQGATILFYTGWLYAPPAALALLGFGILGVLVALYAAAYERMADAIWIAPALVLLVTERSLQNYYEMFYPIALAVLLSKIPASWDAELDAAQRWPLRDRRARRATADEAQAATTQDGGPP